MLSKEQLEQFREAAGERLGGGMLKSEQRQLLDHVWYLELQLRAANTFLQAETERADANEQDAERYRTLRKGQHWSVIDGIGDDLRGEVLDAAIDTAIAANHATIKPLSTKE